MKFGVFVVLLSPESIGGTVLDSAISGEAGEVVMQKQAVMKIETTMR